MVNYSRIAKIIGILLILVLLIGFFSKYLSQSNQEINKGKGEPSRFFTASELQKANEALAKGVRIEDPKDDFYKTPEGLIQGDGRPDSPIPYPLGYTDLKSFTISADESYMYMKYEFWDIFPSEMPFYNGDPLWSTGPKIDQILFYRGGKADLAELTAEVMYSFDHPTLNDTPIEPLEKPVLGQSAMISPTGLDSTGETIHTNQTGKGMVAGGVGTNYILSAIPLDLLGIKFGDEIIFSVANEAGSGKYHHVSVDLLLQEGNNKMGDKIQYNLGASTYKRIPIADYEKLPDYAEISERIRENSDFKALFMDEKK